MRIFQQLKNYSSLLCWSAKRRTEQWESAQTTVRGIEGVVGERTRGRRVEGECREWGLRHLDRAPTHFTRPLLPYLALRTTNATVLSFIFTFHSSAQIRHRCIASYRVTLPHFCFALFHWGTSAGASHRVGSDWIELYFVKLQYGQ